MSMQIKLTGIVRGRTQVLNEDRKGKAIPLNADNFTSDEILEMVENTTSVAIFVRSEADASRAISIIEQTFPEFTGELLSKATKNGGWFVGKHKHPPVDDSIFLTSVMSAK